MCDLCLIWWWWVTYISIVQYLTISIARCTAPVGDPGPLHSGDKMAASRTRDPGQTLVLVVDAGRVVPGCKGTGRHGNQAIHIWKMNP